MQRLPRERIERELAKVDDPRDPAVRVWAWLATDGCEVAGRLLGWGECDQGARRGLVLAVCECPHGSPAEVLVWVRREHLRRRRDSPWGSVGDTQR